MGLNRRTLRRQKSKYEVVFSIFYSTLDVAYKPVDPVMKHVW